MVFNKLVIQHIFNDVYSKLAENDRFKENMTIQKTGKREILIVAEEKRFHFTFNYNFKTHFGRIGISNSWSAPEEVEEVYRYYVQEIIKSVRQHDIQCWMVCDSTDVLSDELRNQVRELQGQEIIPIGEKATNLLYVLNELDFRYSEGLKHIYVKQSMYEEGDLIIQWNLPEGKMNFIYSDGCEDDEYMLGYVLYEIDSKEAYESFLEDNKRQEQQKAQLMQNLQQFVREQDPSIRIQENIYYIHAEGEHIDYQYDVYEDRLCYGVNGFYGFLRTENYEEILSFLKEDFHVYQSICAEKERIKEYLKNEDEYGFLIPDKRIIQFYCSITDTVLEFSITYHRKEFPFHLQITNEGLRKHGQRSELKHSEYETLTDLHEAFVSFYKDRTNAKRMELLFDPEYKKHYRKLFYMINSLDYNWLDPYHVITELTMEEINQELEGYFSEHPIKVVQGASMNIGGLRIVRHDNYIHIARADKQENASA